MDRNFAEQTLRIDSLLEMCEQVRVFLFRGQTAVVRIGARLFWRPRQFIYIYMRLPTGEFLVSKISQSLAPPWRWRLSQMPRPPHPCYGSGRSVRF